MVEGYSEAAESHSERAHDTYLDPRSYQRIVVDRQGFHGAISELLKHKEHGFDTETTGLSDKDRLFSAIWSCPGFIFYFNFQLYDDISAPCLPREYIKEFQKVIDHSECIYIQNAKFDMRMLWYEGVRFFKTNIRCTETLGRILRNDHLQYSLEAQAKRMGLEKDGGVAEYIKKNRLYTKVLVPGKATKVSQPHFDRVPFSVITNYGFQDGFLPLAIGKSHDAEIAKCPFLSQVADNEVKLTRVCFDMERRGIGLNWGYTVSARDYEQAELEKETARFAEIAGEPRDNNKTQFVRLFEAAGEVIPKTDKGNPSLTDDILETFKTPLAKCEQKIRYHEKRIGTYYSSFLYHLCEDGRIRADIRQAGTTTGRFSYRDPNLQNLPKDEDSTDQYVVRGCFQPVPGFVLYSLDYSQLEYRLMLDYAGEKNIIAQILAGADLHQAMADVVGCSRGQAKTLNFAILYGSGLQNIADMLGITLREAGELRMQYFGRLPRVAQFMERVKTTAKTRGFVRNWLGRRCYLNDASMSYIIPNHLIQGGGADVIKKAMVMADESGVWARGKSGLVLQVHDELVVETSESELEKIDKLKHIMETVYTPQNGMRLDVNVSFSNVSMAKRDLIDVKSA